MEPIHIQALVRPGESTEDFVSYTTYDLCGQGATREDAKKSAEVIIRALLESALEAHVPLPQPERQLTTPDKVQDYFLVERAREDGTAIFSAQDGVPELRFTFYRI